MAVAGLSHTFGPRKALDRVSFAVGPGDFTVLLGQNGAGKTTLFALVTRLYHASGGSIEVFGSDIRRNPQSALSRMGVVFQQPTLDLDLTVEQNLLYHASLHGMPRSRALQRAESELGRVDLLERRRDRVRTLSGGQRRRVEVARALLHEPDLLLLDEPTVGLDMASRQFLINHVRGLCATRQLAALWATHLIDEASDDSRVVVLHRGRILASGPVPEVRAETGAPSLQAAFAALTSQDAIAT
ncbi:MAG: ATP-binding cassette domain-containing protein [Acetobacteraceae bacterium]|nr:ATP-binding cassette domain-containing protein [Acetobacteraceae bacterium]